MKKLLSILLMGITLAGMCMLGGCNKYGRFYNLKEAYENGWLTQEDIKSISYYFDTKTDCPEALDEELLIKIKKEWLKYGDKITGDPPKKSTIEDIYISRYYGKYNSCVVVMVGNVKDCLWHVYSPKSIEVGGYIFNFNYASESKHFKVYKI